MTDFKPEEISHPPMDQLQGFEYCIDSNPSWGEAIALGFQHYILALGTVVMIPTLLVPLMGGSDDDKVRVVQTLLFVTGINTLLQTLFGTRLPTVIGGSYAFVVPIISIIHDSSLTRIPNDHERFLLTMRATQGALIISSSIQIILGYSQLWGIFSRFFSPLGMVSVVALVGLGLFDRGFPVVGRCVEIGLPMLILFIAFSQSTGAYKAAARLASATPPPAHVLSRGIGWQGVGILLDGLFGTGTGSTVSVENVGFLGSTRVGSRRVIQISAGFMIFFSILGKFGALFASIPFTIFAAVYCVLFGLVAAVGLSLLQFTNMNSMRNLFITGVSIFLGLSIPQYFFHYTTRDQHGPAHTRAGWFNDYINTIFSSPPTVALIIAVFLDNTLDFKDTDKDRGMPWWARFRSFKGDSRNEEFYTLPFNLNRGSVSSGGSRGMSLLVMDLLVIVKEVVLPVVALVLIPKMGIIPAIVLDPLPSLLHRSLSPTNPTTFSTSILSIVIGILPPCLEFSNTTSHSTASIIGSFPMSLHNGCDTLQSLRFSMNPSASSRAVYLGILPLRRFLLTSNTVNLSKSTTPSSIPPQSPSPANPTTFSTSILPIVVGILSSSPEFSDTTNCSTASITGSFPMSLHGGSSARKAMDFRQTPPLVVRRCASESSH
ncbi:putative nucleobase-ascorbate transporter 9 [Cocos nucifera]|nr:putative nucleobase-ascorbate transporter 9 [Cocos nucifera]